MQNKIAVIRSIFVVSLFLLFLMIAGFVTIKRTSGLEPQPGASGSTNITICSSAVDLPASEFESLISIGLLPGGTSFQSEISSRNDSAKIYFDQGLLMYYSYHTQEAAASFSKAISFDSTWAILYWGKALCYYKHTGIHSRFQDSAAAVQNIKKAVSLQERASPFEAAIIAATSALISDDANITEEQSHRKFETEMNSVYRKHSDNAEAATFYAFSRTWNLELKPDEKMNSEEKTLELFYDTLLGKFPLHPGLHHQFIHFIESKGQLEKGRRSAEMLLKNYGKISHLVHMASHIYIRNGNYRGGVQVNEDAINAFGNYTSLYPPLESGYGRYLYVYHARAMGFANAMMLSSDVQTQRIASIEADGIEKTLIKRKRNPRPGTQYEYMHPYLALIRYGKWKEILAKPMLPDSMICARVIQHFSRGIASARLRDLESARLELASLNARVKDAGLDVEHGFNKLSDYLGIMTPFLSAAIAEEAGDFQLAKKHYEEAISLEDRLIDDDPVQWYFPVRQYCGNMYLRTNDLKNAEIQFRDDLQRHPANYWSLRGLSLVLRGQKNMQESKKVEAQIKNIDKTFGPVPKGAVF